ncbi:MAG: TIGR03435 family protein [Terracidiphilus sp.]
MMTDYSPPQLNVDISTLLVAAALMAFAAPSSLGQAGTATTSGSSLPATAPYVATMTFDVASVRENKNVDGIAGFTMSGWFVPHTTTLRAINWPIENLISVAYGVDQNQIVDAPKWPWPTVFVIEAKGDSEADAKLVALTGEQQWAEQQHMLQALLEERFKLKTHWETKEGDVYNLVVAKGGPKLSAEGSMAPSADELKMFGDHPAPPLFQRNDGEGYNFIAHACSMDQWVRILAAQFGRPVINKTGLRGKYDFVLKYKGRWDRDRNADDMDPTTPMDRALQEQLGLKVEGTKGPVRALVIDHIEKPSDN